MGWRPWFCHCQFPGGAHRIPQTGDSKDDQSSEGRDLEIRSSGNGTQRSGNIDTGGVHWQAAGNSGRVGGVEADT